MQKMNEKLSFPRVPYVSILVPLYNHQSFICRCLDSILEDPYPHKEIIVVDDGSNDRSAEVVLQWQRDNLEAVGDTFRFVSRENRGVTKTLNELVGLSRGELLAIVASDDYLLSGGIQARVDYLLEHPEKMAVFGDCIVVDGEGRKTSDSGIEHMYKGRKKFLSDPQLLPFEIVFHWCVPGPVLMVRREIYGSIGMYDESLVVEDWDFYLRLASRDLLGFIDVPVAAYRVHGNNVILNSAKLVPQVTSLMVTAWKNRKLVPGIRKYHLIAIACKLKNDLLQLKKSNGELTLLGRRIKRLIEITYLKLLPLTERLYQKKLQKMKTPL